MPIALSDWDEYSDGRHTVAGASRLGGISRRVAKSPTSVAPNDPRRCSACMTPQWDSSPRVLPSLFPYVLYWVGKDHVRTKMCAFRSCRSQDMDLTFQKKVVLLKRPCITAHTAKALCAERVGGPVDEADIGFDVWCGQPHSLQK